MGKLYLVGTPIGNLKDITLRAIETLKSVDVIACEDTRHSLTLLERYEISKPLISYHKFNEREAADKIAALVKDGRSVALITDAGMPGISDPGAAVVEKFREEGLEVEAVPGVSAAVTAFSLSGIKSGGFTFVGFLPEKAKDKKELLEKLSGYIYPLIFYVAPHDLFGAVKSLYEAFGDRTVYVAKELTKMHESVIKTTLKEFFLNSAKGEFVLIVEPSEAENPLNSLSVEEHILSYMKMGESKKDAIKLTAKDRGLSKDEVYKIAINLELNKNN